MIDLRQLLEPLQTAQGLTQGAATAGQNLRQQLAGQQLQQQAPDLLNQGQQGLGQLAGLSFAAGDPSFLNNVASTQLKQATDPSRRLATNAEVDAARARTGWTGSQLPYGTMTAGELEKASSEGIKARGQDLSNDTRQTMQSQKTAKDLAEEAQRFSKPINDQATKLDSAKGDLEAALKTFQSNPNDLALGQLGIALAKSSLAGAGRLNVQELAPYRMFSAQSDIAKAQNWFEGRVDPTLTAEQKSALADLAQKVIGSYDQRKQAVLGPMLQRQANAHPTLWNGDTVHPSVTDAADSLGLEPQKQANGTMRFSAKSQGATIPADSQLGQAMKEASAIQDPNAKQMALKKLSGYTVETFDHGAQGAWSAVKQRLQQRGIK